MHRYNINFKDKQWRELRDKAFASEVSISELIRRAIDSMLRSKEAKESKG
jgi:hypothetical protein